MTMKTKTLAILSLISLAGCENRISQSVNPFQADPDAVYYWRHDEYTADGCNVYLTEGAWGKLFGSQCVTDGNLTVHAAHGRYNHATDVCYALARNPAHPTDLEQAYMLHEIGHRVLRKYGWETARPIWLWLAWHYPRLMTHADINDRLKHEHLWPSMFGPAAP